MLPINKSVAAEIYSMLQEDSVPCHKMEESQTKALGQLLQPSLTYGYLTPQTLTPFIIMSGGQLPKRPIKVLLPSKINKREGFGSIR